MEKYWFKGAFYPYPQQEVYFQMPLTIEILTSPHGPEVNKEVIMEANYAAKKQMKEMALQEYGRTGTLEECVLVRQIPYLDGRWLDQGDSLYDVSWAVYNNFFLRNRYRLDEFFPPSIWERIGRKFWGVGPTFYPATEIPSMYKFVWLGRIRGSIDLGEATWHTQLGTSTPPA